MCFEKSLVFFKNFLKNPKITNKIKILTTINFKKQLASNVDIKTINENEL